MFGCCNCGEDIDLHNPMMKVCSDCGGFCCNNECLEEHECDEEGDL